MNLFVSNLDGQITEETLKVAFENCGEVKSIKIIKDHVSGNSRGFGFVAMVTEDGGEKAIKEIDGTSMNGRFVSVRIARPRATAKSTLIQRLKGY